MRSGRVELRLLEDGAPILSPRYFPNLASVLHTLQWLLLRVGQVLVMKVLGGLLRQLFTSIIQRGIEGIFKQRASALHHALGDLALQVVQMIHESDSSHAFAI